MQRVVVIGGGPAGITCAIEAKKRGFEVTILEKNNMLGKKILLTGNGRCNYWNQDMSLEHYLTSNRTLLPQLITEDNLRDTYNFLEGIGLVPKIKDGYYYPSSNQASTVREALVHEVEYYGIEVLYNFEVTKVEKEKDIFKISSKDKTIDANYLILSNGSCAYPKTGSDGSSYYLAKSLGHNIIKVLPSLVPLKSQGNFLTKWDGVRVEAIVTSSENDIKLETEQGEVQLTKEGVSGICIFNLSGAIVRSLDQGNKITLQINFLPWLSNLNLNELVSYFDERATILTPRSLRIFLENLLPYKLVPIFLTKANLQGDAMWRDLTYFQKETLVKVLSEFYLPITGSLSFDRGQVCTGGIPLDEIDLDTMESKKVKGLYLVGELLDVTGKCGGYNLGFAFLSGLKAGRNVGK